MKLYDSETREALCDGCGLPLNLTNKILKFNEGVSKARLEVILKLEQENKQLKEDWVSKQNRIEELENYLKEPSISKQKLDEIKERVDNDLDQIPEHCCYEHDEQRETAEAIKEILEKK